MRVVAGIGCFALALAALVWKFRSSILGKHLRAAGTLWTTPRGRAVYAASKVSMPLAGIAVTLGTAVLGAPRPVVAAFAIWTAGIIALVGVALALHRRVYLRERAAAAPRDGCVLHYGVVDGGRDAR